MAAQRTTRSCWSPSGWRSWSGRSRGAEPEVIRGAPAVITVLFLLSSPAACSEELPDQPDRDRLDRNPG